LMPLLWASLSDTGDLPKSSRISSLPDLATAADRCRGLVGRETVREAHLRFTASAKELSSTQ